MRDRNKFYAESKFVSSVGIARSVPSIFFKMEFVVLRDFSEGEKGHTTEGLKGLLVWPED